MYKTMDDIKAANKAAGQCWFDADTMRFFSSRVSHIIYPVVNGAYFVSSESEGYGERRYSVRYADHRGHIITIGDFYSHESSQHAHAAAQRAAAIHI